jgi:uncharacterized protein (UPF0264 family)
MTMRLLVSARSIDEALLCARAGVDFIDLKEPTQGALGGLPVPTIAAIVRALRDAGVALPVSATIGDRTAQQRDLIRAQVDAVAGCGVTYVKVGITREPEAWAVIDDLAASAHGIVPVFIADHGIDARLLTHTLSLRRFAAVMLDTADKRAGSLFDTAAAATLAAFVGQARDAGALAGLAGALRIDQLPALCAVAPDFAGFRSAACAGERGQAIDPARLQALVQAARTIRAAALPVH